MTGNLKEALFPLLITNSLLGLIVLEWPMNKIITFINIIYILCLWLVYFILIQYFLFIDKFSDIYGNNISILSLYIEMFTTAATMLFCLCNSKNLTKLLKRISVLDDTFEKLGFQIEYKKLRMFIIFAVMGWITLSISFAIFEIYCTSESNFWKIIPVWILYHFIHTKTIMDLTFIILLLYQKNRFCNLNKYITLSCKIEAPARIMVPEDNKTNRIYCSNTMNKNIEDYDIWISMHIHLELSRICNNLNSIFATPMLLEMISIFISGIGLIAELFTLLTDRATLDSYKIRRIVNVLVWNVYCFMKLFVVNYICEIVKDEANRTQMLIQKIMDFCCLRIREEVFQFISEISYMRLKFSALGFSEYGYNFIHRFCGAITTMLVIILQIKTSSDDPTDTPFSELEMIESNLFNASM